VSVSGDEKVELDETFFVNLSNPTNAAIAGAQGTGTITNDDRATLAIGDVTLDEGDGGTTDFVFSVTLDAAVDLPVNVDFTTADGTATAGTDYLGNSGTVVIPPGESEASVTVQPPRPSHTEATSHSPGVQVYALPAQVPAPSQLSW